MSLFPHFLFPLMFTSIAFAKLAEEHPIFAVNLIGFSANFISINHTLLLKTFSLPISLMASNSFLIILVILYFFYRIFFLHLTMKYCFFFLPKVSFGKYSRSTGNPSGSLPMLLAYTAAHLIMIYICMCPIQILLLNHMKRQGKHSLQRSDCKECLSFYPIL